MELYFLAYKKNSLTATAIKSEYERLLKNKDYSLPENGKRYWFRGSHVVFELPKETKTEITNEVISEIEPNQIETVEAKTESKKKRNLIKQNIDDSENLDQ